MMLQQKGSGPILAISDGDMVTGICAFHLFCLQLLLFIDHKILSGTCQNAMKSDIL